LPDCWSGLSTISSAEIGVTDELSNSPDNSARLFNGNGIFGDTVEILPLGNSITQSDTNHYSYRYYLWKKLIDDQLINEYVGRETTQANGNPDWPDYKGQSFDSVHEGHGGYKADKVRDRIDYWLTFYTPDIVLLHLGTNDLWWEQSIESTIDELKEIINKLRADNPQVAILLAQILPADSTVRTWWDQVPVLNDSIPSIAVDLYDSQSPIIIVDQFTDFNPTVGEDTYDGVHPNDIGEEKMAQKWRDAIYSITNQQTDGFVALISPELTDLTSQVNQIRFSARCLIGSDSLFIGTMATPLVEGTYTPYDTVILADTFAEYTVEFDEHYLGTDQYFVFKQGMHKALSSIFIDDIYYEHIPCYAPSNLSHDTVTQTTADLSWTENGVATSWQIRLDTTGFDTTGFTPVLVNENPYIWSGLTANTSYDWYIRAYCGA